MLFREIIVVYSENPNKYTRRTQMWNVKASGIYNNHYGSQG